MKTAHDTGTQVLLYEPTYALSDRRVAGQSFHRNPPGNFSAAVLDALAVCADEVSASVRDLASQFGDRRLPRRIASFVTTAIESGRRSLAAILFRALAIQGC
ncbi:MAG: hypothetical protein WBV25_00630, partial [Methylocella sp.]